METIAANDQNTKEKSSGPTVIGDSKTMSKGLVGIGEEPQNQLTKFWKKFDCSSTVTVASVFQKKTRGQKNSFSSGKNVGSDFEKALNRRFFDTTTE